MAIKATPLFNPEDEAAAVVTNDAADIPGIPSNGCKLYIGVSGDVKVDMATSGTAIVFKAVPVGPFRYMVRRVYATLTTATNIVATW
ncbi:MAG: hypothetical protein JWM41_2904 [Gemmatimonadetes bacterium]|nr:hypothetical protein [Gemmatimonadota bacterium]